MKRVLLLCMVTLLLCCLSACNLFTNSEQPVKIGLQKGDKVYMKALIPALMMEQGKTPVILDFNGVIEKEGTLWVKASKLKEVLPIFSEEVEIFEKAESNCDGYFDINKDINSFTLERTVENTQKLGEQLEVNHISFQAQNKTIGIRWRDYPEPVALENCQVKSITVVQQVSAGEMVSSTEEVVLVDLNQIASYYNNSWVIELDKEANVLLFKMPQ